MLHILSGNPGGGKSYLACERILNELQVTERTIVTNLALNLDAIQRHVDKHVKTKQINISTRIRIIEDEQCSRFFLYRPMGYKIPQLTEEQEKKAERFDLENCFLDDARYAPFMEAFEGYMPQTAKTGNLGGCLYVIDEAHLMFPARGYRDFTRLAEFYLSQHRKFSDDIIAITQFPSKLDKNFRSLAQDITICRNASFEKMQWFRGPQGFLRMQYLSIAGAISQKPQTTKFQRFHFETVGTFYETSAGVGIMERTEADTKQVKANGVHWGWLLFAILFVMAIIVSVPMMMAKGSLGMVAEAADGTVGEAIHSRFQNGKTEPRQTSKVIAERTIPEEYKDPFVKVEELTQQKESPPMPKLKGVYIDPSKNNFAIYLDNGETYKTGDRRVEYISQNMVIIEGREITN